MEHGKLALGTLAVALAAALTAPPVWAALQHAALWQMNERSGKMVDSAGHRNNGTPTGVVRTGSTYVFDGSTSRVVVPDDSSLDPGAKAIELGASVRVSGASMDDDSYDVVRKGLSTNRSGYFYKMEISRTKDPTVGLLHCLFRGSGGRVHEVAQVDIVDGDWHTLACKKTRGAVVATVDGRSYRQLGSAGHIANAQAVFVGAKTASPPDDVFDGEMNSVGIRIAR